LRSGSRRHQRGVSMKQFLIPASPTMKDFEKFLESDYEIGILLEVHIAQLKHISKMAERHGKKMIFHVDLIHGLKNDDYGTEYICQEFNPFGLISTKANVILKAKQRGVLSIQRMFLIDSHALGQSYRLIEKTRPDYIEVLPGTMPWMIKEVKEKTNIKILAGGLIRTPEEVKRAIESGADAVTTSKRELWDYFEKAR
jgi:glycerol uptake operon antiterminator